VIGGEFAVHFLVGLAEVERRVTAVILGLLLLDDIRAKRRTEMIRLAGEVGGQVVIHTVLLEGAVAQIAPQHAREAELVRLLESVTHFFQLARRLLGTEVDGGADRDRAQLPGLLARWRTSPGHICSDRSAARCD